MTNLKKQIKSALAIEAKKLIEARISTPELSAPSYALVEDISKGYELKILKEELKAITSSIEDLESFGMKVNPMNYAKAEILAARIVVVKEAVASANRVNRMIEKAAEARIENIEIVAEEVAQVIEVVETTTIEIAEVETDNTPDQVSTVETVEVVHEINNYMSIKEACYRWGIQETRLREKLNIKRRPSLQNDLDEGRVKYFKVDGMQRGEWTITRQVMMIWYGDEKRD